MLTGTKAVLRDAHAIIAIHESQISQPKHAPQPRIECPNKGVITQNAGYE
jgi:hypothetical protein